MSSPTSLLKKHAQSFHLKRVGKLPLLLACGLVMLSTVVFILVIRKNEVQGQETIDKISASTPEFLTSMPERGAITPHNRVYKIEKPHLRPPAQSIEKKQTEQSSLDKVFAREVEYRIKQQKLARQSDTRIMFDRASLYTTHAKPASSDSDAPTVPALEGISAKPNPYTLKAKRTPLTSPYTLLTGTVIPALMIGGINSDLPGQLIAQVREGVYDTATGRRLLIPQGAKLYGTYSNAIAQGQTRVLVAWNRILFPDGSTVNLGSMPGTDASGYSGFSDQVNNHYMRVFGTALLMSLFSAGIQLSQHSATTQTNIYDPQQIVASSLGLQLGQLGMELARSGLSIQPTLEIRPGYRFNVMVTKDIILETMH